MVLAGSCIGSVPQSHNTNHDTHFLTSTSSDQASRHSHSHLYFSKKHLQIKYSDPPFNKSTFAYTDVQIYIVKRNNYINFEIHHAKWLYSYCGVSRSCNNHVHHRIKHRTRNGYYIHHDCLRERIDVQHHVSCKSKGSKVRRLLKRGFPRSCAHEQHGSSSYAQRSRERRLVQEILVHIFWGISKGARCEVLGRDQHLEQCRISERVPGMGDGVCMNA